MNLDEVKLARTLERKLTRDVLSITEAAAIASARLMGRGDRKAADAIAVKAMREEMGRLDMDGVIVIGEGERDEAPMLYIGERVGVPNSPVKCDIAVDPLEGTNLCATGEPGAISAMACSEPGGLFHAPDIYMDKLIASINCKGLIDIAAPVEVNLKAIAKGERRDVEDLVVIILDRPRHEELIDKVRKAGARIKLIGDGDLSAAISVCFRGTGVHAVMGIGGAPEGVLTAAAIKCIGGEMQARFVPRNEQEQARLESMGGSHNKIYKIDDLAPGNQLIFCATGVTDGELLRGVKFFGHGSRCNSVVMMNADSIVRFIDTINVEEKMGIDLV